MPQATRKDVHLSQRQIDPFQYYNYELILTSARIKFRGHNKAMEKAQRKPTGERKAKEVVRYIDTYKLQASRIVIGKD